MYSTCMVPKGFTFTHSPILYIIYIYNIYTWYIYIHIHEFEDPHRIFYTSSVSSSLFMMHYWLILVGNLWTGRTMHPTSNASCIVVFQLVDPEIIYKNDSAYLRTIQFASSLCTTPRRTCILKCVTACLIRNSILHPNTRFTYYSTTNDKI